MRTLSVTSALLALSLLVAMTINAQEFAVKVTPSFQNPKHGHAVQSPTGFIVMEQTGVRPLFGFFKLDKMRFGIKLTAYNQMMTPNKSVELANGDRSFGPFTPILKRFNDKFYVFCFKFSQSGNADVVVIAAEIDPVTVAVKKEVELMRIPLENYDRSESIDLLNTAILRVVESADSSRLVVSWSSGVDNEYFLSVVDIDMNVQWKKKEMANFQKAIVISSVCIDNAGVVYSTYKANDDKKVHRYIISEHKKRTEKEVLLQDDARPYQVLVLPSESGEFIQLMGTYTAGSEKLAGVFHQKIAVPDLKIISSKKTPFSKEMVERLDNFSLVKSRGKSIKMNPLHVNAIRMDGDNMALVGGYAGMFQGKELTLRIAGSIVAIMFNDGDATISTLHRQRTSPGHDVGDSHIAIASPSRIVIFYNDYDKNLDKDLNDKTGHSDDPRKLVLVAASIHKDGSIKKSVVADLTKEHLLLQPEKASISRSHLLLPGVEIKGSGGAPGDEGVLALITIR